jgi:cytochrome d ubiquinol oxidase subunit II
VGGSLLATFSQGIVVGAVISGFDVADRRFIGSALDWLTPFSLFCGLGLVVAYTLLGTTWLIMKSEGALQQRMRELTRHTLLALMAVIAVVSVWTPLGWPSVAERWFTLPNFYWFVPVPILVLVFSLWIWRLSAHPASHARPFLLTLGLIFSASAAGHQSVAQYHPSAYHAVGSLRAAGQPAIYAGRNPAYHSGDFGLHRMELLRIPRQSFRK